MLKTGIKEKEEIIVNENHSAESLGSGTLKVFGTPAMIALMEKTAWKSVRIIWKKDKGLSASPWR